MNKADPGGVSGKLTRPGYVSFWVCFLDWVLILGLASGTKEE
ncbi:hypothetical protein [Hydrogenophaga pseudoflava]|nr:hypothetical protein [Hydrogenophaga pseudoflava]